MNNKNSSTPVFTKDEYLAQRENNLIKFSEGNHALYNLLDYAWDNNIVTIGCCADKSPYIAFKINKTTNNLLGGLFDLSLNAHIQLSLGFQEEIAENDNLLTSIVVSVIDANHDPENATILFESILSALKTEQDFFVKLSKLSPTLYNSVNDVILKHITSVNFIKNHIASGAAIKNLNVGVNLLNLSHNDTGEILYLNIKTKSYENIKSYNQNYNDLVFRFNNVLKAREDYKLFYNKIKPLIRLQNQITIRDLFVFASSSNLSGQSFVNTFLPVVLIGTFKDKDDIEKQEENKNTTENTSRLNSAFALSEKTDHAITTLQNSESFKLQLSLVVDSFIKNYHLETNNTNKQQLYQILSDTTKLTSKKCGLATNEILNIVVQLFNFMVVYLKSIEQYNAILDLDKFKTLET